MSFIHVKPGLPRNVANLSLFLALRSYKNESKKLKQMQILKDERTGKEQETFLANIGRQKTSGAERRQWKCRVCRESVPVPAQKPQKVISDSTEGKSEGSQDFSGLLPEPTRRVITPSQNRKETRGSPLRMN